MTQPLELTPPEGVYPPPLPLHAHILVIEDDEDLAAMVREDLTHRGYCVVACATGSEGMDLAERESFDLIITDRVLPGLDGLTLTQRLREVRAHLPILMVSAMQGTDDRVLGLCTGADDYLVKPFELPELAARVAALLRRSQIPPEAYLRVGDLGLDLVNRTATRGDRVIELLPREFKLLEYLMRHAGRPVTRRMLLQDVWHYRFVPETNLVDVHIGRLRRKIDPPGAPVLLHSIRGTGFVLRAEG